PLLGLMGPLFESRSSKAAHFLTTNHHRKGNDIILIFTQNLVLWKKTPSLNLNKLQRRHLGRSSEELLLHETKQRAKMNRLRIRLLSIMPTAKPVRPPVGSPIFLARPHTRRRPQPRSIRKKFWTFYPTSMQSRLMYWNSSSQT